MFTLLKLPVETIAAYNKGRRDEQQSIENLFEFLVIKGLIERDTLNLVIEEMAKIDRRPKKEME